MTIVLYSRREPARKSSACNGAYFRYSRFEQHLRSSLSVSCKTILCWILYNLGLCKMPQVCKQLTALFFVSHSQTYSKQIHGNLHKSNRSLTTECDKIRLAFPADKKYHSGRKMIWDLFFNTRYLFLRSDTFEVIRGITS